jgi:hypothetical protein
MKDKVPLHADHLMVVKFNTRNAAGYRTALDKLRQFEKDAPKVVAARFSTLHDALLFSDFHKSSSTTS